MSAIANYAKSLEDEFNTQIAREHAYRPHLKTLLEALEDGLKAVNDPKHSEGGAPDFIILQNAVPIAFLEAKDVGNSLDKTLKTNQLGRYKEAYGNLILTDYLEFRWFLDGELIESVSIGRKEKDKLVFDTAEYPKLEGLLGRYIRTHVPTVTSAEELARKMAVLAKDIARLIELYLEDDPQNTSALSKQKLIFAQELIPSLDDEQFADMYAQTLAYGLFAARVNFTDKPEAFTLKTAFWNLPNTNPFLKTLFQNLATDLDDRIARWGEVIAVLLGRAKMDDILENFGKRTRQTDPVIHFYETFLMAYDPKEREKRGVYYTPEPVVDYIVRGVDHLLRQEFGRDGLADEQTLILDPATGTGTFLYFVIQHIHEQLVTIEGQGGRWNAYVSEKLLKRIFGFELLMASYTVAHMKLQILLKELGYDFKAQERLGVYLTNALEPLNPEQQELKEGLRAYLSSEAEQAGNVKTEQPIMVVLGNPPYSGHSSNFSKDPETGEATWIGKLLDPYFLVDGKKLGERNSKWLHDDYVKFIRMGQDRIQKTGYGVLAFVTNHGYLDNPTFRGMRQSLLQTFTDIYILDLHGNSKKKEKSPDGTPDNNVFDIQQGVAIGIFVKNPNKKVDVATVHHKHLWGARELKYAWLSGHGLEDTDWVTIAPSSPFHLFIPQDVTLREEYELSERINDIFPINSVGIVTARDALTVQYTKDESEAILTQFISLTVEDARQKFNLGKDVRDWSVTWAQEDLKAQSSIKDVIQPILYRPFDVRYTPYTGKTKGILCMPRREVMQHMLRGENLGLITVRKTPPSSLCNYFLVTDDIISNGAIRSDNQSIDTLLPLYIYKDLTTPSETKQKQMDLEGADQFPYNDKGRRPNLSAAFVKTLEERIGKTFQQDFSPEQVFYYAYAVFHSPTYRTRYAEFLKIDFPRLPLPKDWEQFEDLAGFGQTLAQLHLMTHPSLHQHGIKFPVAGTDTVDKTYPKYHEGRVYINKTQYFEGIEETVWEFYIGGYQVLQKWLKDRVGRTLKDDDIVHYQRVIKALRETMRVMEDIDERLSFPIG